MTHNYNLINDDASDEDNLVDWKSYKSHPYRLNIYKKKYIKKSKKNHNIQNVNKIKLLTFNIEIIKNKNNKKKVNIVMKFNIIDNINNSEIISVNLLLNTSTYLKLMEDLLV